MISFLLLLVIAELLLCVLGYAGHTVPNTYINGEYRLEPTASGTWIKGTNAEIKSRYQINNQGFNSTINYSFKDTSKIYIALIGDSYVEGLHSDVDSSIGRRIERHLPEHEIEIHEYGISGWNAWNYLKVANDLHDNYRLMYILVSEKDLFGGTPSKMQATRKHTMLRRSYNASNFLRYMNINRGIKQSLYDLGPKSIEFQNKTQEAKKLPEYSLLTKFPENCIFLFEEGDFHYQGVRDITTLKIIHTQTPINYGLQDSHWNNLGRENCARTAANSIKDFLMAKNNYD